MTLIKETIQKTFDSIRADAESRRDSSQSLPIPKIYIGKATCGIASGALDTENAFREILQQENIEANIQSMGCIGHCYAEPVVVIDHPDSGFPPIFYHNVTPGKAKMLIKSFLKDGDPLFEHLLGAMVENDMIPQVTDFPRFNMEKRVVMERCGKIDPEDIYGYIATGGYSAFIKALNLEPEEIVNEITESGLRGRGGAGFPTGQKWRSVKDSIGDKKVIICNADEGDPGAYMDRTILESNPHQILEGMAICAHAIDASKAIVYVRSEYPLAVKMIKNAINQAEELGVLGKDILGSSFDLEISVFQGSGAFVCGEETALIRSIEGSRGMPRHRPPYPSQKGIWGQPTVINNVKTFSTVPSIINKGADWFKEIGTENSPGTAIFSVVGDIRHAGLVEIPMGVSLRSLLFEVCGGVPNKKSFKAVQIGGPIRRLFT